MTALKAYTYSREAKIMAKQVRVGRPTLHPLSSLLDRRF